jgi:DNA replication protein DnaC
MNDSLRTALKQLRLSGLLASLEVRLQEAASHGLNHAEFLELILQDELLVRSDRLFQRRVKAAGFREQKTLDDFDWLFNPAVPKKRVFDLASGRFIREHRDVLWLGPPGIGKSHLVQAIGWHAVRAGFVVLYRSIFDVVRDFLHDDVLASDDKVLTRYLKPDLLIIDDMGMKQLPRRSGECLFKIIMRRYETVQMPPAPMLRNRLPNRRRTVQMPPKRPSGGPAARRRARRRPASRPPQPL